MRSVMFAFLSVVGNAVQTVKCVDSVKLITVRSTAFEAAAVDAGSAHTESGSIHPPYQLTYSHHSHVHTLQRR